MCFCIYCGELCEDLFLYYLFQMKIIPGGELILVKAPRSTVLSSQTEICLVNIQLLAYNQFVQIPWREWGLILYVISISRGFIIILCLCRDSKRFWNLFLLLTWKKQKKISLTTSDLFGNFLLTVFIQLTLHCND